MEALDIKVAGRTSNYFIVKRGTAVKNGVMPNAVRVGGSVSKKMVSMLRRGKP